MNATKNVLVVEDEPLIAMMIENFLEMLDREVVGVADSVSEALRIIGEQPVDVAILDRSLVGGEKSDPVAEELARRGIPFIVASGGGISEEPPVFHNRPTLAKPFTLDGMEKVLDLIELQPTG